MIVGESSRERDIAVNVTKGKNLTNTRAAGKDHAAAIKTPKTLTLEEAIEFLNDDEYCEVTPESLRLRKKILNTSQRKKFDKRRARNEN
jgi:GTP-binding protein